MWYFSKFPNVVPMVTFELTNLEAIAKNHTAAQDCILSHADYRDSINIICFARKNNLLHIEKH